MENSGKLMAILRKDSRTPTYFRKFYVDNRNFSNNIVNAKNKQRKILRSDLMIPTFSLKMSITRPKIIRKRGIQDNQF